MIFEALLVSDCHKRNFKEVFFNNFSFFDWPFRICLYPFVEKFTSFIALVIIFTKKDFLNAGKLICFLFPFCLTWYCWGLGSEKELCIRNADLWSWEWNVGHCAHSCRLLDGNKPFSKKTWKEMTIIFIYVLSKV